MKWAIPLIFLLLLIFFFFPRKTKNGNLSINGKNYQIEYALTTLQKAKGLSNRDFLCENCGMLFVFDNSGSHPFWMKDTKISLDMIWLDQNGKIVHYETASPEPNIPITQLKVYKNPTPSKYVLELNAGDFDKLNLKIGDIIKIKK